MALPAIRIQSDGGIRDLRVVDASTGKPLDLLLTKVDFHAEVGETPTADLHVVCVGLDVQVNRSILHCSFCGADLEKGKPSNQSNDLIDRNGVERRQEHKDIRFSQHPAPQPPPPIRTIREGSEDPGRKTT